MKNRRVHTPLNGQTLLLTLSAACAPRSSVDRALRGHFRCFRNSARHPKLRHHHNVFPEMIVSVVWREV